MGAAGIDIAGVDTTGIDIAGIVVAEIVVAGIVVARLPGPAWRLESVQDGECDPCATPAVFARGLRARTSLKEGFDRTWRDRSAKASASPEACSGRVRVRLEHA